MWRKFISRHISAMLKVAGNIANYRILLIHLNRKKGTKKRQKKVPFFKRICERR
jgi:hypothetical protein